MTFGVKRVKRLITGLAIPGVIWVGTFIPPGALAEKQNLEANYSKLSDELTLAQLTTSLSLNPIHQVHFEESYVSHLLTSPVKKLGWLSYAAPSRFEKHITKPVQESFIVDQETVLYENTTQGITQSLSLQDFPPLQVLIDGLRSIFSGDLNTLRRLYRTELSGTNQQWVLTLVPLKEDIRESVKLIRLSGSGEQIKEIEIREANGDYSTLLLTEF